MPEQNIPKSRSDGENLIDQILKIDHKKATKFIIYGLIAAMICGTVMTTSKSIESNAADWKNVMDQQNEMDYWNGFIGLQEFNERQEEIQLQKYYMDVQFVIFGNIARIGVNIALLFVVFGFIGYSLNKDIDPRIKQLSFVLAGLILVVLMFTTMFSGISISVS
jgi:hypothetical protein